MSVVCFTSALSRARCLLPSRSAPLLSYVYNNNSDPVIHCDKSPVCGSKPCLAISRRNFRTGLPASRPSTTTTTTMTTPSNGLLFRQLFDKESWTYTYILADEDTREAIIIDPVIDQVERDIKMIEQNDLKLKYALNTHVHADHITGSGVLKRRISAVQSAISLVSGGKADVYLSHGSQLSFGRHTLEARSTPGHTSGCMSFLLSDAGLAFTGDALLIRGCGRTDFQEGDAATLYESVWREIFSLPDATLLYPAHDYVGLSVTSVKEEKAHNPRLTKSKEGFIEIMNNLNLPYPKQIDKSLPANLVCGLQESLQVQ